VIGVIGDKYMFLTYYAHLVGIKEVTDYKNARRGSFKIIVIILVYVRSRILF
jgi:hypothetical protein